MNEPAPHPLLIRLAHALLDKAGRSQGQRAITLKLDAQVLPELHATPTPDALASIAALLQALTQTGWVTLRTRKPQAFQTLADQDPTLVLHDAEALALWSAYQAPIPKWSRELVRQLGEPGVLNVPDTAALLDYLLRNPLPWLADKAPVDAARVLNALAAACAAPREPGQPQDTTQSERARYLRELSAMHFKGHSKVLDQRGELLRLLGGSEERFPEAPIQLLVSLPDANAHTLAFDDVLFIENLVSFERMSAQRLSPWARSALVFSAGFKGAARRLRQPQGTSLYWRGPPSQAAADAFTRCLLGSAQPAVPFGFYGDLDFAGMQILSQLRQSFAHCTAWQPGYAALASALQAGHGHAPQEAGKEAQTDPGQTGCPYADSTLLPLLRQYGTCMDQEFWPAAADQLQPWPSATLKIQP